MPRHAALQSYSDIYTSTQAYISGVVEEIRGFINVIGRRRFPRSDLNEMQTLANGHFESATDLTSVLWQNGLLGYIGESGDPCYYSLGDVEEFKLPAHVSEYVFHPCLAESSGIAISER